MAERTILLTGASGLLGTWLRRTAPAGATVVPVVHRTPVRDGVVADLRDADAVAAAVVRARPSVVIHTAYAKDEASIVDSTRNVVDAATIVGAHLVHISTDALFSGDGRPRAEDAVPDPIFDYGRWKAEAEAVVARTAPSWTIVRPSLVVSLDPEDHVVAQIRAGAAEGRSTPWFDDEVRQPALASDLARAVWALAGMPADRAAGVWHLPGQERLTRYDIARRVVAALGLPADAVRAEHAPDDGTRPRDLHLLADRARLEIGWSPSPVLAGAPPRSTTPSPALGGDQRP